MRHAGLEVVLAALRLRTIYISESMKRPYWVGPRGCVATEVWTSVRVLSGTPEQMIRKSV